MGIPHQSPDIFKTCLLYTSILRADKGRGNGKITDIQDLIYVDPRHFDRLRTEQTVSYTHLDVYKRQVSPNVVSRRLSSPEIRNALGTSLATLLERVSGVSSISTGTTVSKPVIQGMYGNRILIIHNGARQTCLLYTSRCV